MLRSKDSPVIFKAPTPVNIIRTTAHNVSPARADYDLPPVWPHFIFILTFKNYFPQIIFSGRLLPSFHTFSLALFRHHQYGQKH
jgi:hypothetical protein